LRAGGAQPVPQIAVRVLIETNNVVVSTVDRKIAQTGGAKISSTGRRPTEQILRAKIAGAAIETRSKAEDLIDLVLGRAQRVVMTGAGRSRKLE
jgi:hypothetical protein